MVAVRHRPKSALGARQVASEGLPADVDVRLFGEAGEGLPDSSEEDGYRARIAESSVAEMAVDAPKCSICPLVKWECCVCVRTKLILQTEPRIS